MDRHGSRRAARLTNGCRPTARAWSGRSPMPICAASTAPRTTSPTTRRSTTRCSGAFELAGARNGAPAAVRAFNPTLEEHGYQPAGSVVETSTPDIPFLVDSVSEELLARGLRVVRNPHPIVGLRRGALGRDHRGRAPGRGAGDRVGHALRARPAPRARGARRRRGRGARRSWPTCGASSRPSRRCASACRRWRPISPRRAPRATRPRTSRRTSPSCAGWPTTTSSCSARASTRSPAGRSASCPARVSGCSTTRDARRSRGRCLVEDLEPGLRERATEGELLIVSRTNRLSPVHRRERMDYVGVRRVGARRRDRRRVAPGRPVHVEGLRRARVADPAARGQAAAHPRRRGPRRRLARRQGRAGAVRLVPEGRAAGRADRGPAARDRRAHGPARRPRPRPGPPRRRRPRRVGDRRAPARPVRPGAARAPAGAAGAALRRPRRRRRRGPRRARGAPRARALRRPPPRRRAPRGRDRRPPGRGARAGALVGRPRPRGARGPARPRARADPRQALDRALPGLLQGRRRPGGGRGRHRGLRAPLRVRAARSTSRCATTSRGRADRCSRGSASTGWARRSSCRARCRCSSTSACA